MSGITFFVCFGKPAGIRIQVNRDYARLCLGPVSFWVMFHDFEQTLSKVLKALEKADAIVGESPSGQGGRGDG